MDLDLVLGMPDTLLEQRETFAKRVIPECPFTFGGWRMCEADKTARITMLPRRARGPTGVQPAFDLFLSR